MQLLCCLGFVFPFGQVQKALVNVFKLLWFYGFGDYFLYALPDFYPFYYVLFDSSGSQKIIEVNPYRVYFPDNALV